MVAKGPSVAFAKMRRFAERKDRSLCVMMKKRVDMDKAVMEELVKGVHSGIERVFFPRQRVPRSEITHIPIHAQILDNALSNFRD